MYRLLLYLSFIIGSINLTVIDAYGTIFDDKDKIWAQTVKISVQHKEGTEVGAGVILCYYNDQLFIITAKHVVFGEGTRDSKGRPSSRFRNISEVKIESYQGRWLPIKVDTQMIRRSEHKDLALLRIPMASNVNSLKVDTATINDSAVVEALQKVYTLGHPSGFDWSPLTGDVMLSAEFIVYNADIEKGYSGGPLINADGELIGINTHIKRMPHGAIRAQAIPINEALNAFKPWMDLSCLNQTQSVKEPASQQRIEELLPQIEREQAVDVRGEVICRDDENLSQCKQRALKLALENALQPARENLTAFLSEMTNLPIKRNEMLQRLTMKVTTHEIISKGFVGENGYFYKIHAKVKARVPDDLRRQMLGQPFMVAFKALTPEVTYDHPNPTKAPYGTMLTVTASKSGYQSKTITREVKDDTEIDFGALNKRPLTVKFQAETPGVTYDHPNPSQLHYGDSLLVTASKKGYRSKTISKEGLRDDTTLDFGVLLPLKVTVNFISQTSDVVYNRPNPSQLDPESFFTVTASKPGYLSKTQSKWIENEDITMDFGRLELIPINLDIDRLLSGRFEGLVPLWLLDFQRLGVPLDAYRFKEQSGDFRVVFDTGFSRYVNESGERTKPYLEVIGRQVPSDITHYYGVLLLRSPDTLNQRPEFEQQVKLPPLNFDFSVKENSVASGRLDFGGGQLQDRDVHLRFQPAYLSLKDVRIKDRIFKGAINLNFDGLSIEDGYVKLMLNPLNLSITDIAQGEAEPVVSVNFDGMTLMNNRQLLWRLGKGRLEMLTDSTARSEAKPLYQLELKLNDLRTPPANDLAESKTIYALDLVAGLHTAKPEEVTVLIQLLHRLFEYELRSLLQSHSNVTFQQKFLVGQLVHRLWLALEHGLAISIQRCNFVIDDLQNHMTGRIYWNRDIAKLKVESLVKGQLPALLRMLRVEIDGTVAVESLVQMLGLQNDQQWLTLKKNLVARNWVQVDEKNRLAFNLTMADGKVYIGGKDIQKLLN